MMSSFSKINLLIGLGLIFLLACCRDDDQANPCAGLAPVTADFTMKEVFLYPSSVLPHYKPNDTDTIFSGGNIEFSALEPDATYTWQIGIETLHERTIKRKLFPAGEQIPITLTVEKSPNLACFPDDDGIDSLTRYLYRLEDCQTLLAQGRFTGSLESSPSDTFTVIIDACPPYPIDNPHSWWLYIKNIPPDCDRMMADHIFTNRQITFCSCSIGCNTVSGQILISETNRDSVKITYTFNYGEQKDEIFVFNGLRY